MSAPIRMCPPDLPLEDAAELMADERIHCLAVVEVPEDPAQDDRLIGLLSALDLVAALDASSPPASVAELVGSGAGERGGRRAPQRRRPPDARVAGAAPHRGRQGLGRPVGLLSTLDILRALAELKRGRGLGQGGRFPRGPWHGSRSAASGRVSASCSMSATRASWSASAGSPQPLL